MTLILCVAVFVLAVFLSAVFSGGETGVYCLSRVRMTVKAEQGDKRARRLEHTLRDRASAVAMTLVGTNIANYVATVAFAVLLVRHFGMGEREAAIYTTLIVACIALVFGEVVPKNLFQSHPDRLMRQVSGILRVAEILLFPVIWVLTRVTRRAVALFGETAQMQAAMEPREQMAHLLREALPSSGQDDAHHEMVDRALLLAKLPVHAVMTPRNHVVAVPADAGRERLLSVARAKNHSRLPVFGRHPRRIEGLAEVHRLLDDENWRTVGERLSPVTHLDPHDSVASALVRLQRERTRMAIVVDRGGHMLGIVTLKDLLEELVGELPAW
jgi:putative hemolysin